MFDRLNASILAAATILFGAGFAALPANADDVAGFYTRKQVTLVIGYGPGAGYDLYGRLLAKYLEQYIPGKPTIVTQNMDGAGTVRAANWLYNVAPRDGSYFGMVSGNIPLSQAMQINGIQFDSAKFNWIGNPDSANRTTIVLASTGVATISDLKALSQNVICGGPGINTQSIQFPQIMNNLLGTKMRIIAGFPDGNSITLAMGRGEANCRAGNSWAGIKSATPEWVRDKKVNVIMQWGLEPNPEIEKYMGFHVPLALEFAQNPVDRTAIQLLQSSVTVGRPFLLPPGVPQDRVDALRSAFDSVMADQQFLAEADKLQLDIDPLPGVKLQPLAAEIANADKSVLKRAQELSALNDVK
jgi:tripartite-type tricarboxylate transporter receptor subunit TctC